MNDFDKTNGQDVTKVDKRRSFLKKSATGAVVFSLPAKSVWGACSVSGALSGNLSTNGHRHDCTMPRFLTDTEGADPSIWENLDATIDTDANANSLFSHLETKFNDPDYLTYADLKAEYVKEVNLFKAMSLNLPVEYFDPSPTVGFALTDGDADLKSLAAVFLNASFGLYSNPDYNFAEEHVNQLVNDIFLFIYTNAAQDTPVSLSASDFGFTDPSAQNTTLVLTV